MNNKKHTSGFSLVEVMVSVLVLVVLLIGGASVMYQTGGSIQRQQNKREALIAANNVLERFWNRSYEDLRDNFADSVSSLNAASVNGQTMALNVAFSDELIDANGHPYIEITVDINHLSSGDDVVVVTRRYPYGIGRTAL